MASIKDAFEESIQEENATLKYIIFAIPIYYWVDLYVKNEDMSKFWILALILIPLYIGFLTQCTTNVRNGKNKVLPSFNIFSMFWDGIKCLLAIGPSIAINCILASICSKLTQEHIPESSTLTVFLFAIWGLFISFILTSYLCYIKDFKILDAYNLKTIYNTSVDVFFGVIFMIPQVLIANAILIMPVTYIIWIFFGIPNPIATFYWCCVFIFNLALCGHYLAQIGYEAIATKENQDKLL